MTAGRRGGVTKGRGCSPVVRSPFSASIFLLDPRYSTLHRPRGSIIISGKDVKNFSRNFSFQSRTYRRMISQFFQRIDIDIERSSEIFQLPRRKRRVEKGKSVFSPNQLSPSSLLLSLLSSTSSTRKQKWKKNS